MFRKQLILRPQPRPLRPKIAGGIMELFARIVFLIAQIARVMFFPASHNHHNSISRFGTMPSAMASKFFGDYLGEDWVLPPVPIEGWENLKIRAGP